MKFMHLHCKVSETTANKGFNWENGYSYIYYWLGVNFKECEGASITYNEIYAFALQSV
jgi:hypothetical protein